MRWGHDDWQQIDEAASVDSNLGFHVAVLDTTALTPGSRVDFTWRRQDDGEWAGHDIAVLVRSAEMAGPVAAV